MYAEIDFECPLCFENVDTIMELDHEEDDISSKKCTLKVSCEECGYNSIVEVNIRFEDLGVNFKENEIVWAVSHRDRVSVDKWCVEATEQLGRFIIMKSTGKKVSFRSTHVFRDKKDAVALAEDIISSRIKSLKESINTYKSRNEFNEKRISLLNEDLEFIKK